MKSTSIRSVGLGLWDAAGRGRAGFILLPDGSPWLNLADATGNCRAQLTLAKDGCPGLSLAEAGQGKTHVLLALSEDDSPFLQLLDADGQLRTVVGYTETVDKRTGAIAEHPESALTLLKENGEVLWQAP